MNSIRTLELKARTAEQFIDLLSRRAHHFGNLMDRGDWVFRGHANSSWQLLPSVFRPNLMLRETERNRNGNGWWVRIDRKQLLVSDLIHHEYATLRAFFEMADAAGLPLPEDTQALRIAFNEYGWGAFDAGAGLGVNDDDDVWALWPSPKLYSLCALAQHYGTPTRLLDWTRNALIAAYFAAEGVHRDKDSPSHMCVWAFCAFRYTRAVVNGGFIEKIAGGPVDLINAPAALIPNLRAQDSLFTLLKDVSNRHELENPSPFDAALERHVGPDRRDLFEKPMFLKVVCPTSEAPKLLRLLHCEGVDAARLFPGYFGVSRALREQQLWDGPIPTS